MRDLKLSIDYVRDIILNEMSLDSERVNIYNQKFNIPTDEGLFVVVEYNGTPQIISSRNYIDLIPSSPVEYQDLNTQENIIVGLFSKNLDAIKRKEEAVMAFNSVYAQQIQEINSFKISRNIRIEDISFLEATARLYRFDLHLVVFAWYNKTKTTDFYDSFSARLLVNDGEPLIEVEFDQPLTNPVP